MELKNNGNNEFELHFPFPCPENIDIHGLQVECYDRTQEERVMQKYIILIGTILEGSILDVPNKTISIDPNEITEVRKIGIYPTRFVSSRTHFVLLCPEHPMLDRTHPHIEELLPRR